MRQYMSLDDDIIESGYGPKKAKKIKELGSEMVGQAKTNFSAFFRRAQRRVEQRHFRDRTILLHHEKTRKKMQREMGQDPYLDTADS